MLFVYLSSFISQILDFLYWIICIFIFHGVTVKTENTRPSVHSFCELVHNIGRDPFNQTFRKFRSKTQWIGSVQPEKFRKNGSTFWGGPLFPVGPVGILVEWIAPIVFWKPAASQGHMSALLIGWFLIMGSLWLVRFEIKCWLSKRSWK